RRLEAAGYTVSCHLDGLGSQPEIQAMYQARLRALLEGH
ncbi:MAG: cobalt chelatase, partial [Flavonifractor sp.]|nr:cobalt chelatase [Flavonifractor sp.]